ncbi:polysaccharide deacetylase family protein [Longimicrobium sp.]|uniref:polysaccharide deacetylase family protein n=1 Tax=Longimicrobium sp. TaxID=2029185 RepID=UPI002C5A4398|nr:polysaccharide deacetylase family protein [Longimicrobium sp.]HSU12497.1 polysaccharide deacetylase family protein [Longimicrobium sp.]
MAVPFSMSRARSIAWRFGVSPRPMEARMARFDALTAEFGVRPTWAVTASVLHRNQPAVRRFCERGVEFAVHGLAHDDLALRSPAEQRASIARAVGIFHGAGVPFSGFRAPFLRASAATDDAVAGLGFVYHSTTPVAFDAAAFPRAIGAMYPAYGDASAAPVRPAERGGVVHLPVALPDDALLVERLRFSPAEQAITWRAVLETTWRRGELFTLRLHPERIYECEEALGALLADARGRRPPVWIATLDRIARWWRRRAQSKLAVHELEPGRVRVVLDGDPMATLLVRNLAEGETEPWFGADRVARSRDFEAHAERKPVVGVSTRSPAAALTFLAEEGFPAEVSDDAPRYGAWIDVPGRTVDEAAVLAAVEAADGPMVRLGRWPAGARSALAVTGDIGCMTLQDFALRAWEGRR